MKLCPISNSFKKLKELFNLIFSKISSDGGDFPRIIEIALFLLKSFLLIQRFCSWFYFIVLLAYAIEVFVNCLFLYFGHRYRDSRMKDRKEIGNSNKPSVGRMVHCVCTLIKICLILANPSSLKTFR